MKTWPEKAVWRHKAAEGKPGSDFRTGLKNQTGQFKIQGQAQAQGQASTAVVLNLAHAATINAVPQCDALTIKLFSCYFIINSATVMNCN